MGRKGFFGVGLVVDGAAFLRGASAPRAAADPTPPPRVPVSGAQSTPHPVALSPGPSLARAGAATAAVQVTDSPATAAPPAPRRRPGKQIIGGSPRRSSPTASRLDHPAWFSGCAGVDAKGGTVRAFVTRDRPPWLTLTAAADRR